VKREFDGRRVTAPLASLPPEITQSFFHIACYLRLRQRRVWVDARAAVVVERECHVERVRVQLCGRGEERHPADAVVFLVQAKHLLS
jgi:hypothetical protein